MYETTLIIAETIKVIGEILIAIVVLGAHEHIIQERRIDLDVLKALKRERLYAFIGIVLIIIGFLIEVAIRSQIIF